MKNRRTESLLLALASGVIGIGALCYLVFVATSWRGWMTLAVALLGLLWADHFHHGARQK